MRCHFAGVEQEGAAPMRALVIVGTLSLTAYGCTIPSVPKAPPAVDRAAKAFAAPPGRARLFVFSRGGEEEYRVFAVSIDAGLVGSIKGGLYLVTDVAPGTHDVCAFIDERNPYRVSASPQCTTLLDVSEGVYFIRIRVKTFSNRVILSTVAEGEGRAAVMKCRLTALSEPPP
jgi:hypothetical protein